MANLTHKEVTLEDLKEHFHLFLAYVWQYLQLPPPTPKQQEMAHWLQDGTASKRQIIMALRGLGKSWVSGAFVVWCLWKNPQLKILVVSASGGRAASFTKFCQRLIMEIDFLKHLVPDQTKGSVHRWSSLSFDVAPARVAQSPSLRAVGIGSQITGSRANIIIADDVETPESTFSGESREKLLGKVGEFESILLPEGRIIYLGTPHSAESLYAKLRDRDFDVRIWPARVPTLEKYESYQGCLAPSIEALVHQGRHGEPTDTRFTDEDLLAREARMGRTAFAMQFMLDLSLSDAERYPLKTGDLIVVDNIDNEMGPTFVQWSRRNPEKSLPMVGFTGDRWYLEGYVPPENRAMKPFEGRLLFIDPSGRGAAECVGMVVHQLHGKLFLVDFEAYKDGYGDATLRGFARLAKRHKVNRVVTEANFGDGMFTKLLQPVFIQEGHRCHFEEVKHSQQKEARMIDTLEPVLNQHRLVVSLDVIQKDIKGIDQEVLRPYSLFYQLTHLTRDKGSLKHDDRLDALAGAVAYWVESMGRDHTLAHKTHLEDAAAQAAEDFLRYTDHGFGAPKAPRQAGNYGYEIEAGGWL